MKPTIGRIVLYKLSAADASMINRRRDDALVSARKPDSDRHTGKQAHTGNNAYTGDVYPMMIVRVWPDGLVNGQVILDGNDTLWTTSVGTGVDGGQWAWPERA